ncbi:MAG: radical SAM protein [Candidatus Cloacimonetes bacterium]|nr:radical SAM protein [Candidatus Cloacimonadota bacterium]
MSFFNLSNIQKALFHAPFIRKSNYFKMAVHTFLESKVLKKTITYPKVINFLLTMKCNLRCEVCHAHDALLSSGSNELKTDFIKSFIQQCGSFSPDWHFSGGEPFAHKDLYQILNEVHSHKMKSSLVSNGLLITQKKLEQIKPGALSAIIFSIMGDEKGHDKEVMKVGAFQTLVKNIQLFAKYQPTCKIFLNLILTPSLVDNIKKVFEDIKTLPIEGIKFTHLNYLTSSEIEDYKIYATDHDFGNQKAYSYRNDFSMDDYLNKLKAIDFTQSPFPYQFAPDLSQNDLSNWYNQDFSLTRKCHFIWYSTFLYSDGQIKSCQFLQEPMGNIKDKPIIEIWNSPKYQKFRQSIDKKMSSACARCCKL